MVALPAADGAATADQSGDRVDLVAHLRAATNAVTPATPAAGQRCPAHPAAVPAASPNGRRLRVAVLGASGRTGRHLVELALAAGHQVRALVRDPAALIDRPGLTMVKGDVRDRPRVAAAVAGIDVVVSVLGPRNGASPDSITAGLRNVIEAMRCHGIRRIVTVATSCCDVAGDHRSVEAALAARKARALIGADGRAKQEQLGLLRESGLDWTALRPPRLTDEVPTGRYVVGGDLSLGFAATLPRTDLAAAILAQLSDPTHVADAPFCTIA